MAARSAARLLRTRWFVRAPIWLYRAGLGFVVGQRLLMLEHIGRVSGQRRYVILEVVDHSPGHYVVVAGFGQRAQWLLNVQANPQVRLWVSTRRHAAATARRMEPAETVEALHRYAQRHPRAWRGLVPVLEQTLGATIDEHGTTLPVVDIELRPSRPEGRPDDHAYSRCRESARLGIAKDSRKTGRMLLPVHR